MGNKLCKFCGSVFSLERRSVFCSDLCSVTFNNRRKREEDPKTKKTFLIGGKLMVMRPAELEAVLAARTVVTRKKGNVYFVVGYSKPGNNEARSN